MNNPLDKDCICHGNWRAIIKQYEHLIGQQFNDEDGNIFTFIGVIHGEDDYYYGMWCNSKKELRMVTCVADLLGVDFTPVIVESKNNHET